MSDTRIIFRTFGLDADEIIKTDYPVYSCGKVCERSSVNYKVVATKQKIILNNCIINNGDYILANSCGIAIIEPNNIEKVLKLAEKKKLKR